VKPPKRKVCPLCGTPIRKDDPVRRGRHADCDTYEPFDDRSTPNTERPRDNHPAFTVTGRRNHERHCQDCNTIHAGDCQ
jgi:hypothetical protein